MRVLSSLCLAVGFIASALALKEPPTQLQVGKSLNVMMILWRYLTRSNRKKKVSERKFLLKNV